jgi:hypothetical protein
VCSGAEQHALDRYADCWDVSHNPFSTGQELRNMLLFDVPCRCSRLLIIGTPLDLTECQSVD